VNIIPETDLYSNRRTKRRISVRYRFKEIGWLLLTILAYQSWQGGFAQGPVLNDTADRAAKVVVIPATGYKPAPKNEESARGKLVFEQLNCMACHSIHNAGGDLGPMLDGVGGRRSPQFLIAHLSNAPDDIEHYRQLRGPLKSDQWEHSRYSRDKADSLVAYLMTIPEPPGGFVVMPHTSRSAALTERGEKQKFTPQPTTSSTREGANLYNKFGCVACHSIGDIGGWLGPRLDGIGARHTRSFILEHVSPAEVMAKSESISAETKSTAMPRMQLEPEQAKKIVDYLLTLPASEQSD
jgi:cytochrome c2